MPPDDKKALPPGLPTDSLITFDAGKTKVLEITSQGDPEARNETLAVSPDSAAALRELDRSVAELPENRFEMQRVVGSGGFGEVWEAVQVSLGRTIALKRPRDDYRERYSPAQARYMVEAFRQEAFAAAGLEHPNIVPVHDLSYNQHGDPMIAMKLVRGKAWDALIREEFNKLVPEEFLAHHLPILIDVAQAVAFAHSKGIVHRDLKPSQVMLGEFGEVLLMDWGLSLKYEAGGKKAISAGEVVIIPTPATATNPAGTPAFMAPEQTLQTAEKVGPWTDVYLLGGTLYYLLTGTPPHDAASVAATFFRAQLGNVEPATKRCPERRIPEELEAIATRALAPEVPQRTPTAAEFLKQLREYVGGAKRRRESVELTDAVRRQLEVDSNDYRAFSNWQSRLAQARVLWPQNPDLESIGDRLLADYARAAIRNGDLVLAQLQADQITDDQRRIALEESIEARRRARRRREQQRRYSVVGAAALLIVLVVGGFKYGRDMRGALERQAAARKDSEQLTSFMLTEMRNRLEPLGKVELLRVINDRAFQYLNGLPEDEMSSRDRNNLAASWWQSGKIAEGMGDLKKAIDAYGRAVAISEKLVADSPSVPEFDSNLALITTALGEANVSQGKTDEGLVLIQKAQKIRESVAKEEPANKNAREVVIQSQYQIAEVYSRVGRFSEAEDLYKSSIDGYRKFIAEFPHDSDSVRNASIATHGYAEFLSFRGRLEESLPYIAETLAIRQRLADADPKSLRPRNDLAQTLQLSGNVNANLGRFDKATTDTLAVERILTKLSLEEPDNVAIHNGLSGAEHLLADIFRYQRKYDEAATVITKAVATSERLRSLDPTNLRRTQDLASDLVSQANALLGLEKNDEALLSFRRVVVLCREVLAASASDPLSLGYLWEAQLNVGDLLLKREGELDAALQSYRDGIVTLGQLVTLEPKRAQHLDNLAYAHYRIATVLAERDRWQEGWGEVQFGIDASRAALRVEPKRPASRSRLAVQLANAAQYLLDARTPIDAPAPDLSEINSLLIEMMEDDASDARGREERSWDLQTIADTFLYYGKFADARSQYEYIIRRFATYKDLRPESPANAIVLIYAHSNLALALAKQGEGAQALELARKGLDIASAQPDKGDRSTMLRMVAEIALAQSFRAAGRPEDARMMLEKTAGTRPQGGDVQLARSVTRMRAEALLELGRPEEALPLLADLWKHNYRDSMFWRRAEEVSGGRTWVAKATDS